MSWYGDPVALATLENIFDDLETLRQFGSGDDSEDIFDSGKLFIQPELNVSTDLDPSRELAEVLASGLKELLLVPNF